MTFNQNEFDRDFEKFKHQVDESVMELTKTVEEEHKLEQEVTDIKKRRVEDDRKEREDLAKISHLRQKVREIETIKVRSHTQLQQMEEKARHEINEHVHDKDKMIKPLHH